MPNKYGKIFGKVLKEEFDVPDIKRNAGDVRFDKETDTKPFDNKGYYETDDLENAGFTDNNMEGDSGELIKITDLVKKIEEKMQELSGDIAKLERNFSGISKSTDTVADVLKELHKLGGELMAYRAALPARQLDKEQEQEKAAKENEKQMGVNY